MKRLGTLLVFESHVTVEQAKAALKPLVDAGLLSPHVVLRSPEAEAAFEAGRMESSLFLGFGESIAGPYRIERFEDSVGGPVWYIP